MSMITADIALSSAPTREAAKIRRLPRALGLGMAALATGVMWYGAVVAIRFLF
jgi:hypothetical protein